MDNGKKSFSDQYKSPKWQKKRLEILERDNFTCQNCGDVETELHVHHLIYFKNVKVWDYDNCYLSTYCEDCHYYWHEIYDNIKLKLCLDLDSLNGVYFIIDLINKKDPFVLMQTAKVIEEMYKIK